ncbi:MAG: 4Fe-4S binding protein [Clostridiales bacterium]|nr:4Fe-4S binding protein [Clostridiales bacterium]
MKIKRIVTVYFSPTGGTKKISSILANDLGQFLNLSIEEIDFTLPPARTKKHHFSAEDLLIISSPVYAGRLPNKIMPDYKQCFSGEDTLAVPMVVYGNRNYGDALTELCLIMRDCGFHLIGAAAMVSRHAFSQTLAKDRPDERDMAEINTFAKNLARSIKNGSYQTHAQQFAEERFLKNLPSVGAYYTPLREDGTPAKFLKAKPQTNFAVCNHCGICVNVCPMGSITADIEVNGVCIKCQACVRKCPQQTKFFDDAQFLSHVRMLERDYTRRAENYITEIRK